MKKYLALVLIVLLLAAAAVPVLADGSEKSQDIVILYTNDVHTYLDGELSYDLLAGLKARLQTQYEHVLLVDAGDHVQGTAYGSVDHGKTVIELMNASGYDLATLGNHEFDYGMAGRILVTDQWAQFPYVSCNFYHEENGARTDNVLDSYRLFDCGDETVAFVGITTPETFSKSSSAYFQDENGDYIYGISGGSDGEDLYADVQLAIDEAKADGATKVIALGHLGVDLSSGPWTSRCVIANTEGLDAFIDGHSHTTMEGETVTDEGGNSVVLTQTGQYFEHIGMMLLDAETGAVTTTLLSADEVEADPAPGVKDLLDSWIDRINEELGKVIGTLAVTLDNYDENGVRLVRCMETNTGDFCADAIYYLFDSMGMEVDAAISNGGGVRNKALTGDVSYLTCKNIHPFGNVACLQTVTGQQILDALEWGARMTGTGSECGGFLQVSGILYSVNTAIPSTVRADEHDNWIGGPTGEYRVHSVRIYDRDTDSWEPLEPERTYNLAGFNYTLRDLGDGYGIFSGAVNVLDYVMEDYMVLANYIQAFPDGVVDAYNSPLLEKYPGLYLDYNWVWGSGRITLCPCADEDLDHLCDSCFRTMTACEDGDHDHLCDMCGEVMACTCGAAETVVTGAYTDLTYYEEDGALLADVTVQVQAVLYDLDKWYEGLPYDPADGTVTVSWQYDGRVYTAEPVDETGTVSFAGLPAGALDHGGVLFLPADPAAQMPARNGLLLWAQDNAGAVTVDAPDGALINGVGADSLRFLAGTEITVEIRTASPVHVLVETESGSRPDSYRVSGNLVTFTMPAEDVRLTAVSYTLRPVEQKPQFHSCPSGGFTDLSDGAWYHEAVDFMLGTGLMNGVGSGKFDPNGTATRAMVVTMLWRLEGKPGAPKSEFSDVRADSWYAAAVNWAASKGIIKGYGDGRFGPGDPITREQLVSVLYRYAGGHGNSGAISAYADAGKVSAYAVEAMEWACRTGILNGRDNALAPQAYATRAELAAMLLRLLK